MHFSLFDSLSWCIVSFLIYVIFFFFYRFFVSFFLWRHFSYFPEESFRMLQVSSGIQCFKSCLIVFSVLWYINLLWEILYIRSDVCSFWVLLAYLVYSLLLWFSLICDLIFGLSYCFFWSLSLISSGMKYFKLLIYWWCFVLGLVFRLVFFISAVSRF